MSDAARLRELADKQAITELIYTYCRAVDRCDAALGHSIWHEGGQADYGAIYRGSGPGVIDQICRQHQGLKGHSHQVSNILIALDGDRAGSESYVHAVLQRDSAEGLMQMAVWGRYLDSWERREGRWGLVHRMVVFDLDEVRPARALGQETRSTRDPGDPSYRILQGRG